MKQFANNFAPVLAVAALAFVPAALAQNANRLTPGDTAFAEKAAQGNMAEVRLGDLAQKKAESPDVKAFGKRMMEDHTRLNHDLQAVAGPSGVTMPTTPGAKEQEQYNRLSQLSGAAFDHAYMRDMLADHRADISAFRREADDGTNPEMKAYAAKSLPVLEEHLKLAETTMHNVRGEKK